MTNIFSDQINNIYGFYKNNVYRIFYGNFVAMRRERENRIPKHRLAQKHVQNLKMILDRESLLHFMPKNSICAEIGVSRGDFSELILKETKPKILHLIDLWGDSTRYDDGQKYLVEKKFANQIKNGSVEINLGYSTTILKTFPDKYFDWVYLDTSHTYEVTSNELKILKSKIKDGGIIAGHDYILCNWVEDFRYGVIEAVHELCVKDNWELVYLTADIDESPSFAIRKIK